LVTVIFVGLVYLQNDFSTAFFLFLIAICMFYLSGVKLQYLFGVLFFTIICFLMMVFTKAYRLERFLNWADPRMDPSGSGYQMLSIMDAFDNGGFFGRGIGYGLKKLGSLPESWSDFILAVIAEEAGLIGVVFVIVLFAVFTWHGFNIARNQGDLFRYLLGSGLTMTIVLQAIVNFAVVAQVLPTTGIPLPFFSHGGSALMMNLCMCGLLINMARTNGKEARYG
jgi:cell division protein FtsW